MRGEYGNMFSVGSMVAMGSVHLAYVADAALCP